MICNNPSLYAYQIASILNKKENIRILSLGTGEKSFKPITGGMTKWDWISKFNAKDEFVMNMDVYTAHWYLRELFDVFYERPDDYVRLQTVTTNSMDKVDPDTINGLIEDGVNVFDKYQSEALTMIHKIIDEKYGNSS